VFGNQSFSLDCLWVSLLTWSTSFLQQFKSQIDNVWERVFVFYVSVFQTQNSTVWLIVYYVLCLGEDINASEFFGSEESEAMNNERSDDYRTKVSRSGSNPLLCTTTHSTPTTLSSFLSPSSSSTSSSIQQLSQQQQQQQQQQRMSVLFSTPALARKLLFERRESIQSSLIASPLLSNHINHHSSKSPFSSGSVSSLVLSILSLIFLSYFYSRLFVHTYIYTYLFIWCLDWI
jgi:hypothetical protein